MRAPLPVVSRRARSILLLAVPTALTLLTALPAQAATDLTRRPDWLGAISSKDYDGVSDHLLTAGLGKTGLGSAAAPTLPADPAAALRRLAIYSNYRALVDTTPGGGYGTLFGPNINAAGVDTGSEGLIAGTEYIAYADDGSGRQNVTLMVQLPTSFNSAHPCIVSATSSGSRGVYGAIGTAGEWGLKHGCAVAYSDKGTGNGVHDLSANTVSLQDGTRSDADAAGTRSNFTAPLTAAERAAYVAAFPDRYAVKHAHSQLNPEKDWGRNTLQAVQFAFYVLNQKYQKRFNQANTLTIASSVSNGAGAAIAALEEDDLGLISGLAVAEPSIALEPNNNVVVRRGNRSRIGTGLNLLDYFTLANLFQPCAALASPATNVFNTVVPAAAQARCDALAAYGVTGADYAAKGASALQKLIDAGYEPESAPLQAAMFAFATPAIVTTYANAYGRFSVRDNVCGWSFAGPHTFIPVSFGAGNGIPPTLGIDIVKNGAGGSTATLLSLNYDLEGAQCARDLAVGNSAGAMRVRNGIDQIRRNGNLRGRPAIIVHGRSDTLIPVGFTSRPYFGLNKLVEGRKSQLSYIEVTNAQHFDAFLGLPGFAENYVPLHRYFIQAMDLMYAHLRGGQSLPESQVVRTIPRGKSGAAVNPITTANVPPIGVTARAGDRISYSGGTVFVPD